MNKKYKVITWIAVMALLIAILALFLAYRSYDTISNLKENNLRYEMYNKTLKKDAMLNGVYHVQEEFYCVYVGDRSLKDIKSTDYHEMAHHLIEKDYYHFCEEYY